MRTHVLTCYLDADVDFTFTEKMLAACPVCIVMSLVCRNGSQMMACWSSEPEARRLETTNTVSS